MRISQLETALASAKAKDKPLSVQSRGRSSSTSVTDSSNQTVTVSFANKAAMPPVPQEKIEKKKNEAIKRKTAAQYRQEVLEKGTRTIGIKTILIEIIKANYTILTGVNIDKVPAIKIVKDRTKSKVSSLKLPENLWSSNFFSKPSR